MCNSCCECKNTQLYTATEVALILPRIEAYAEGNGTWERTTRAYREKIASELSKLPLRHP